MPKPRSVKRETRDETREIPGRSANQDVKNKKYSKEQVEDNIKEMYLAVKKDYDNRAKKELKEDYMQAIGSGENFFRGNLTEKGHAPGAMEFATTPSQQKKFSTLSKILPKADAAGQPIPTKVPNLMIKKEGVQLQMNHWIKINSNISTEDRKQATHFPLIDAGQNDDDMRTLLGELFPDGVHGMIDNWESSTMNDWLLYSLMRRGLEKFKHSDHLYSCINELWPNKWTRAKLRKGFPSLCAVFAEDDYDVKEAEPWKKEPKQQAERPRSSSAPVAWGHQKKVHVAKSKIAGYGLFIDETAKKDEFIIEYTGEWITEGEADRRGNIYDKRRCSYLYNLEKKKGAIDATRVGNESRFANHSDTPNLTPKWRTIGGGKQRIAYFAVENLEKNTELTVDYGYTLEQRKIYFPDEAPKQ